MKYAGKPLIDRVTDQEFLGWRINAEILRRCGRLPVYARLVPSVGGMPPVRWYSVNARPTAMPREDAYMKLSRDGVFSSIQIIDPQGYERAMADIESYATEIDHANERRMRNASA